MRIHAPTISRILLGLIFVFFGLNGILQFIPPAPLTEAGLKFMEALKDTGYLFNLIKVLEIGSGLLLLLNRYVPLSLLLLSPGAVNIFLFHVLLSPAGLPVALTIAVLMVLTSVPYWKLFKEFLKP